MHTSDVCRLVVIGGVSISPGVQAVSCDRRKIDASTAMRETWAALENGSPFLHVHTKTSPLEKCAHALGFGQRAKTNWEE